MREEDLDEGGRVKNVQGAIKKKSIKKVTEKNTRNFFQKKIVTKFIL